MSDSDEDEHREVISEAELLETLPPEGIRDEVDRVLAEGDKMGAGRLLAAFGAAQRDLNPEVALELCKEGVVLLDAHVTTARDCHTTAGAWLSIGYLSRSKGLYMQALAAFQRAAELHLQFVSEDPSHAFYSALGLSAASGCATDSRKHRQGIALAHRSLKAFNTYLRCFAGRGGEQVPAYRASVPSSLRRLWDHAYPVAANESREVPDTPFSIGSALLGLSASSVVLDDAVTACATADTAIGFFQEARRIRKEPVRGRDADAIRDASEVIRTADAQFKREGKTATRPPTPYYDALYPDRVAARSKP